MFNIEIKKAEKILHVSASGMISRQEGLSLYEGLKENFAKVDTKDYSLVIDSRGVKPTAQDTLDVLQKVMDLYMSSDFKYKFHIAPESAITSSQNKRLDTINFHKALYVVSSYEEILGKLKENK